MPSITDILPNLKKEDRFRTIPAEDASIRLDLSSNDYLGLATRTQEFVEEFHDRFPDVLFSSSASRLLSSRQKHHLQLESFLSELYGKEALLFNSGYHANVGCIGALFQPSVLFICDKLVHASIIDGLRINSASFKRFPHNDTEALLKILIKESSNYEHIVIVVESIYSMDGDIAPLKEIVALKNTYPDIMIYVDEAHAFGVRGELGLGLCEELGVINDIDLLIGTFGKAAASMGAFAITSEEIKNLLINCARPFIFSTALPPVNVAWSLLMTEKILTMQKERRHLANISRYFAKRIGAGNLTDSQIIPYLTGDASKALEIAAKLREEGILALPIRRPTVPPGGERIRFSLSAAMSEEELTYTAELLNIITNS